MTAQQVEACRGEGEAMGFTFTGSKLLGLLAMLVVLGVMLFVGWLRLREMSPATRPLVIGAIVLFAVGFSWWQARNRKFAGTARLDVYEDRLAFGGDGDRARMSFPLSAYRRLDEGNDAFLLRRRTRDGIDLVLPKEAFTAVERETFARVVREGIARDEVPTDTTSPGRERLAEWTPSLRDAIGNFLGNRFVQLSLPVVMIALATLSLVASLNADEPPVPGYPAMALIGGAMGLLFWTVLSGVWVLSRWWENRSGPMHLDAEADRVILGNASGETSATRDAFAKVRRVRNGYVIGNGLARVSIPNRAFTSAEARDRFERWMS